MARAIKQGDNKALNTFYEKYAGKMLAICKRYLSDGMLAEDVLMEGLTKAIAKIDQFSFNGSFEGWVKRIIVNEALMKIRSQKNNEVDIEDVAYALPSESQGDHLEAEDRSLAAFVRWRVFILLLAGHRSDDADAFLALLHRTAHFPPGVEALNQ